MRVRVLTVLCVLGLAVSTSWAAELSVDGRKFELDGKPFDLWGIRVASASQSDELTEHLIGQLDDYRAHGVNTVCVYYVGSSGGYSDPFSPDGKTLDPAHRRRMEQILRACDERGMVAVVGIFYQRSHSPKLRDWPAVRQAVRTVTESLKGHENLILNIANEQNSSRYEGLPWAGVRDPEKVLELCRLAKQVDPDRLVGAGGYDHDKNEVIGRSDAVDVLLFDTNGPESSGELFERFVEAGIHKPIANVETFGGWTKRFMPRGVFSEEVKDTYRREVDEAAAREGLYLCFHNNPWCQPDEGEGRVRYDLAGHATEEDPGIRWYFEYVEAVREEPRETGNRPERVEWFMDQGLGMFIHWSFDSQVGSVISHSMVGASQDYLDRFVNELPGTFYPRKFEPDDWARLARVAGFRYVVFTTKHHSGFCMWDTETTDFNVMHTPYGQDIVGQVVEAFRRHGIAVGFYFSPEDFWMLYQQGHEVARRRDYAQPSNNPELMAHNKAQVRELLTEYGPVDVLFFDAEPVGVKELAWSLQPNVVVTRGEMETPEQYTPDEPVPGPWEACYTLGTQWHFKPTNEDYKSGTDLIEMLVEIRAKGGNFLLNVGPQPDGEIPFEQERRIRELALWMFVNGEAVTEIRPWHVIREGDIWFTKARDEETVYAILTGLPGWTHGERKEFVLKSVRAGEKTQVDVLGQTGNVVEYQPKADAQARWRQEPDGLHISVVRAQRLYNNRKWPNPVVVRITNASAAK